MAEQNLGPRDFFAKEDAIADLGLLACPGAEELAEQVGLTPAYIGHLEAPNISKALSLDTLFDIAVALDVAPQKFLAFED